VARDTGGTTRRPIVTRAGKYVCLLELRETCVTTAHVIRAHRMSGMLELEGDNL
jgi:hypothetical protein